jgi:chromosome segregation ATPase
MIEDTESLRYDTEQRVVANHEGFALLNEMRYLRENLDSKNEQRDAQSAQMQSQIESLLSQSADTISQLQTFKSERELDRSQIKNMESQIQDMDSQIHDLQSEISDLTHHRAALFAVRERGISTWVRDAFTKDTHRRKDRIASLNKEIIHAGDIWTDAVVVTKRFADKSTERREFVTLYGLTPEQVKSLGIIYKFSLSSLHR